MNVYINLDLHNLSLISLKGKCFNVYVIYMYKFDLFVAEKVSKYSKQLPNILILKTEML